ncbi:hypothetical protein QQ008_20155 [Fulvivirgaceae bacterium BMA10]|uniref:Uncharacterized protein n=1 Tax=Splendidivirga corallicola TaxID=3051826 RepID=A0ABT8KU59_9BACT|nr:hypothetical protein [Fulvivirgaceae bacterium BMA10]
MEDKYLLDGESIITQSGDKSITLTNYRLRFLSKYAGRDHLVSILLEKIASIEIVYKGYQLFLSIGIVSFVFGIFLGFFVEQQTFFLALVIGAISIVLYITTRRHVVTIASDGGSKINFHARNMKVEMLLEFINKVENAKMAKKP